MEGSCRPLALSGGEAANYLLKMLCWHQCQSLATCLIKVRKDSSLKPTWSESIYFSVPVATFKRSHLADFHAVLFLQVEEWCVDYVALSCLVHTCYLSRHAARALQHGGRQRSNPKQSLATLDGILFRKLGHLHHYLFRH